MNEQKFVIHLAGRSCAGKSTVAKLISAQLPGIFTVDYDHLKWQLAGYNREVDTPTIEDIGSQLYETICRKSIPVMLKLFSHDQAKYDEFKAVAAKYGYRFIPIFLTAPDETLIDRFRKRVVEYQAKGLRMSYTDEDIFKSWLKIPFFQSPEARVFDTSITPVAEIADQIIKMV